MCISYWTEDHTPALVLNPSAGLGGRHLLTSCFVSFSVFQWTDEHTKAFEKKYESDWQPPPGVQLLSHKANSGTARHAARRPCPSALEAPLPSLARARAPDTLLPPLPLLSAL